MKRHGHLFEQLVSWPNLLRAVWQATRGKRHRENVLRFQFDYERELLRLEQELKGRTYRPGSYHTCRIAVPKPRMISAAPFRDRVLHHALVNVLEPIFERRFIYDSYACRTRRRRSMAIFPATTCSRYASVAAACRSATRRANSSRTCTLMRSITS